MLTAAVEFNGVSKGGNTPSRVERIANFHTRRLRMRGPSQSRPPAAAPLVAPWQLPEGAQSSPSAPVPESQPSQPSRSASGVRAAISRSRSRGERGAEPRPSLQQRMSMASMFKAAGNAVNLVAPGLATQMSDTTSSVVRNLTGGHIKDLFDEDAVPGTPLLIVPPRAQGIASVACADAARPSTDAARPPPWAWTTSR